MKEHLARLVRSSATPVQARNMAREYLQALILEALQRTGAMVPLAFHGGTALRFLYALPRYSEDLDFALERPGPTYDLRAFLRAIAVDLASQGYVTDLRLSDRRVVHSAFVRFPGLPFDLGLSPHRSEVLAVKIEVDTRPPAGAGLETTLIRRHITLRLQHHNRASLLAGKLHALLQRPYTKGRDLYDLVWYLSDPNWPAPNLDLLTNALRQTGWQGAYPTPGTWRALVRARLESVAWPQAIADVLPFLEREADVELLTREQVLRLLS